MARMRAPGGGTTDEETSSTDDEEEQTTTDDTTSSESVSDTGGTVEVGGGGTTPTDTDSGSGGTDTTDTTTDTDTSGTVGGTGGVPTPGGSQDTTAGGTTETQEPPVDDTTTNTDGTATGSGGTGSARSGPEPTAGAGEDPPTDDFGGLDRPGGDTTDPTRLDDGPGPGQPGIPGAPSDQQPDLRSRYGEDDPTEDTYTIDPQESIGGQGVETRGDLPVGRTTLEDDLTEQQLQTLRTEGFAALSPAAQEAVSQEIREGADRLGMDVDELSYTVVGDELFVFEGEATNQDIAATQASDIEAAFLRRNPQYDEEDVGVVFTESGEAQIRLTSTGAAVATAEQLRQSDRVKEGAITVQDGEVMVDTEMIGVSGVQPTFDPGPGGTGIPADMSPVPGEAETPGPGVDRRAQPISPGGSPVERPVEEQFGDIDWSMGFGDPREDEVETAVDEAGEAIQERGRSLSEEIFKPQGVGGQSLGEELLRAAGRDDLANTYEQSLENLGRGLVLGGTAIVNVPGMVGGVMEGVELGKYYSTEVSEGRSEEAYEQSLRRGSAIVEQAKENPWQTIGLLTGSLGASTAIMKSAGAVSSRAGLASRVAIQPGEEALGYLGYGATKLARGEKTAQRLFPYKEPLIFSEEAAIRAASAATSKGRSALSRTETDVDADTTTSRSGIEITRETRFEGQSPLTIDESLRAEIARRTGLPTSRGDIRETIESLRSPPAGTSSEAGMITGPGQARVMMGEAEVGPITGRVTGMEIDARNALRQLRSEPAGPQGDVMPSGPGQAREFDPDAMMTPEGGAMAGLALDIERSVRALRSEAAGPQRMDVSSGPAGSEGARMTSGPGQAYEFESDIGEGRTGDLVEDIGQSLRRLRSEPAGGQGQPMAGGPGQAYEFDPSGTLGPVEGRLASARLSAVALGSDLKSRAAPSRTEYPDADAGVGMMGLTRGATLGLALDIRQSIRNFEAPNPGDRLRAALGDMAQTRYRISAPNARSRTSFGDYDVEIEARIGGETDAEAEADAAGGDAEDFIEVEGSGSGGQVGVLRAEGETETGRTGTGTDATPRGELRADPATPTLDHQGATQPQATIGDAGRGQAAGTGAGQELGFEQFTGRGTDIDTLANLDIEAMRRSLLELEQEAGAEQELGLESETEAGREVEQELEARREVERRQELGGRAEGRFELEPDPDGFPQDETVDRGYRMGNQDEGSAADDGLGAGWYNEFVVTLAGGDFEARSNPSQEKLREIARDRGTTLSLPTRGEVSGSDELQENIDDVLDAFTFADLGAGGGGADADGGTGGGFFDFESESGGDNDDELGWF